MRLIFTRHGESEANRRHEISNRGLRHGLTRRGREQAATLAERLRPRSITRIFSSPLLRAIETSVILAHRLACDYEIVDALREYDCGIVEGRCDDEAWRMWQELYDAWIVERRWEQRIEGGESFYDLRARFVPFVEGLAREFGDTDARFVCVSHGGLYAMMLPLMLPHDDPAQLVRGFSYADVLEVEWRPGGYYRVDGSQYGNGRPC